MRDNPVVKAGEDDGELINSRDRSWPDVLYSAPALYILLIYVRSMHSSIHVFISILLLVPLFSI